MDQAALRAIAQLADAIREAATVAFPRDGPSDAWRFNEAIKKSTWDQAMDEVVGLRWRDVEGRRPSIAVRALRAITTAADERLSQYPSKLPRPMMARPRCASTAANSSTN
jgi:hypothetical protein